MGTSATRASGPCQLNSKSPPRPTTVSSVSFFVLLGVRSVAPSATFATAPATGTLSFRSEAVVRGTTRRSRVSSPAVAKGTSIFSVI